MTIGTWPSWSVTAARDEAKRLKRDIDRGEDPMDIRTTARQAPTVKELIDRYIDEHLPKLECTNAKDQSSMLNGLVLPDWRTRKVADITPTDVDHLLTKIALGRPRPSKTAPKTKRRTPLKPPKPTPIRANRAGEMLRKMFSLAVTWKMRTDNPATAFRKRPETARERFLSFDEIQRLADVLDDDHEQRSAGIIRLCMLTGARVGEVRTATFDQFNLDLAIWTKQAAYTKQRRVHRVPISHEAVALIRLRRTASPKGCPFLFPGDMPGPAYGRSVPVLGACPHQGRNPRRPHPRSATHLCLPAGLGRGVAGNDRTAAGAHPDRHHPALCPPDRLSSAGRGERSGRDVEATTEGGEPLNRRPL